MGYEPSPGPPDAAVAGARRVLDRLRELAALGDSARFRHLLWERHGDVHRYLSSLRVEGSDAALTESYVSDALVRFLRTLELVPLPPPGRILEIGSNPYFFHALLSRLFPSAVLSGTNFFEHDVLSTKVGTLTQRIRSEEFEETYDFSSALFSLETVAEYPFAAESFDLVFFCETLEHLVVDPLAVFDRIRRLLAPGGRLVVTLPNAVRLTNVALILAGCNFFDLYHTQNGVHGRHNREFTLEELSAVLGRSAFVVERAETQDRYDYERIPIRTVDYTGTSLPLPWRKSELERALRRAGGRLDNRGDNLYVVARRPRSGEEVGPAAGCVPPRLPARPRGLFGLLDRRRS